jgi:Protein of unknown function (DUF2752)
MDVQMTSSGRQAINAGQERATAPAGGADAQTVGRRRHVEMLAVAVAVVAGAYLLAVRSDQRVVLLSRYPLPELCLSRSWFGVECPGCGLTRSIVLLAHGDWRGSLAMHRLGWLMALSILLQFPYRLLALSGWTPSPLVCKLFRWFGYLLILLLLGNWLVGRCLS